MKKSVAIFSERYIPNETIPVSIKTKKKKNFGFENHVLGTKMSKRFEKIYPKIRR